MSTKFVWTNPQGGSYGNSADWDENLVPSNGDDFAYLQTLSRAYVVSSNSAETVGFLEVDRRVEFSIFDNAFTIAPTSGAGSSLYDYGNMAVGAGGSLVLGPIASAEINGPGNVVLAGSQSRLAELQSLAVQAGLYGGGSIELRGNAEILGSTTAASTLENNGDKILGWGEIGNDNAVAAAGDGLFLVNGALGKIIANGAYGDALVLDTGSNLISNSGLIETVGAGGLTIDSQMLQDGQLIAAGLGSLTIGHGAIISGAGAVEISKNGLLTLADGAISTQGALTIGSAKKRGGVLTTSHGDTIGIGADDVIVGDTIQTDVFNYGIIEIANNSTLNLNAAVTQYRTAQIALAGSSGPTRLELFDGGASIWGGQLTMSDSSENFIVSNGAAEQLNNYATINGAGVIGDKYLRLDNGPGGVIKADQSVGLTIVGDSLAPSQGANLNVGLIEAIAAGSISPGMLTIEGELQNAGQILAKSQGEVVLDGGAVDDGGGLVETLGNGEIVLENGSVISHQGELENGARGTIATAGAGLETIATNLLNYGDINVVAGSTLLASGSWKNFGVINFGNPTQFTGGASLEIGADDRLDLIGSGLARLNNAADTIVSAGAGALLTNDSETIQGAGTLGDADLSIVNAFAGKIDATGAMTLGSLAGGAPDVVNSGLIEASIGATLTLDGVFSNAGELIAQSGGTIDVKQSDLGAGQAILEGTGVIDFSGLVNNEIVFDPKARAEAILEAPTSADGAIWGFAANDTIDLTHFSFVNGSTSVDANLSSFGALSGSLVLTNGTSTSQALFFQGDYQNGSFEVSSDHLNGTLISWVPNK
jgi:hypothetical protein